MRTIERAALIRVIRGAASGTCAQSTRAKLLRVAETTDAVAVGWFHVDGYRCPARQAGRGTQKFQEAFDRAMSKRYGVEFDRFPVASFAVKVVSGESGGS